MGPFRNGPTKSEVDVLNRIDELMRYWKKVQSESKSEYQWHLAEDRLNGLVGIMWWILVADPENDDKNGFGGPSGYMFKPFSKKLDEN